MKTTTAADGTTTTTFDFDDVVVFTPEPLATPHSYPRPIPGYAVKKGNNQHWIGKDHLYTAIRQQLDAWDNGQTL
jgi:hypothetical protein